MILKWSAIALAVVASVGRAQAQSSVSIAGRVDVGPQIINNGAGSKKRVDSGTYTASRLIFKGTEDLGGGLSAGFYLENRFNADTGAPQSATTFFNGGSQVFIASKDLGSLTLGRQYVPIFWSFLFADDTGPLKLHGYSALQSVQRSAFARISATTSPIKAAGSLDSIGSGVYTLSSTSAFENNLIVYKTPKFGGVTAMLAGGAPEGSPAGNGRVLGGNIEYNGGPPYASVAFNQKRDTLPAGPSAAACPATPRARAWATTTSCPSAASCRRPWPESATTRTRATPSMALPRVPWGSRSPVTPWA